jgi:DNA-binding transcriptional MerR regulator
VSARTYLSIGDVLSLLRQEFPDVTISKIRFLESQGLVNPERSPSGYRKFYEHDVERLRWVLRQQRENFLPLKVIRDRLGTEVGAGAADAPASDAPVSDATEEVRSTATGGFTPAPVASASPAVNGLAERQPSEVASATSAPAFAAVRGGAGGDESARTASSSAPSPSPGGAAPAGPAARQPTAPISTVPAAPVSREPLAGRPGFPAAPPAARAPEEDAPRRTLSPAAAPLAGGGAPAVGVPAPGPPAGPARMPQTAPAAPSGPAPSGLSAPSGVPAGGTPATGSGNPAGARGAADAAPRVGAGTAAGGTGSGAREGPVAAAAGGTGASLTLDELAAASGLSVTEIASLEGFGLIAPLAVAGVLYYDEDALTVAKLVAQFRRYGVEPRHLRQYRNAADREMGLIEQIITPLLRQRNPESRQRAVEAAGDLAKLGQNLHITLLRRELRRQLGG